MHPLLNVSALRLYCVLLAITAPSTVLRGDDSKLPAVATPGQDGLVSSSFIYELEGRPTNECHASTIVELNGELCAAWFGGKHENNPDVGIWFSRRSLSDGGTWSTPVQLVDGSEGEGMEYACWNPVLFQPSNGPLLLFYKVGRTPSTWWGCLITSDDGGQTWSTPRRLGTSERLFPENPSLLGPVKNKPVELEDGAILCPSSTENQGWRVHFELTRDLGKTWQVIGPLLDGEPLDAIQPSILTHADGRFQILCRTRQGVVGTSWSSDRGLTWSPVARTNLPNPNAGTDAVTLSDGRHLLVYNHSLRTRQQDGRQILNVAISQDGIDWKTVMTLEQEGHENGYSYPAVIQTSDGMVHITYTWRRETIKHAVVDPTQW
jgi:predicted neuraminidase